MADEKKSEGISAPAEVLLRVEDTRAAWETSRAAGARLQVASVVGVFPYLYERVRTLVEFPEEALIQRRAMERILRRRLAFSTDRGEVFARSFLNELITARYLPNDFIPEATIPKVVAIIEKYQVLPGFLSAMDSLPKVLRDVGWRLAAREIESLLLPRFEDEALATCAVEVIAAHVKIKGVLPEVTRALLAVAVRRTILHDDNDSIMLAVLKERVPNFEQPDMRLVAETSVHIQMLFSHPVLPFLCTRLIRVRPIFLLLKSLAAKGAGELMPLLKDQDALGVKIQEIIYEGFAKARVTRFWSVVRSLLYIFLSKIALLLLIEFPYEKYVGSGIKNLPIMINLIAPPVFIVLLTSGVRAPKSEAVKSMIQEITSILYEGHLAEASRTLTRQYQIRRPAVLRFFFWFLYALLSFSVLGAVGVLFLKLQFSLVGLVVFYTFMSLVGFFGFRIRAAFAEAAPLSLKEPLLVTLFDLLFLPFMNVGRYLARTFAKVNVFVVFLDFLIEVPFKAFFNGVEEWLKFVKEKKDDMTRGS